MCRGELGNSDLQSCFRQLRVGLEPIETGGDYKARDYCGPVNNTYIKQIPTGTVNHGRGLCLRLNEPLLRALTPNLNDNHVHHTSPLRSTLSSGRELCNTVPVWRANHNPYVELVSENACHGQGDSGGFCGGLYSWHEG